MSDRNLSELELIERYKKVRVVDVIDASDRYGFHNNVLVPHEIKALYLGIRMASYAVTVRANRVQEEIPSTTLWQDTLMPDFGAQ